MNCFPKSCVRQSKGKCHIHGLVSSKAQETDGEAQKKRREDRRGSESPRRPCFRRGQAYPAAAGTSRPAGCSPTRYAANRSATDWITAGSCSVRFLGLVQSLVSGRQRTTGRLTDIDCNFRIWCARNFYTSVGLARRPHIDRTCSEHAVGVSCIPSEPQEREARPRAKASRRQGIREAICPALRAIGDIMSNGCVGNFHIPDEMPGGRDGHICGIGAG